MLTGVRDPDHQELAEDVGHHLDRRLADHVGVAADQVNGRREQAGTRPGRFHPHFLVLAVQEVIRAVPDELSQGVP